MALVAVLVLLAGSLAGLVVGRWPALVPLLAAIVPAALVGGPNAGAIGALAGASFIAGVHLHRVVAEQYAPR